MSMIEEHSHSHGSSDMGPFQGSPKTMFFLGLFAGIAACATVALVLVLSMISSGKGLSLGSGSGQQAPTVTEPTAPTPPAAAPSAAAPVKPVDEKTDHIIGAKNAKVTLIEYSDFECPFCKRHFATMEQVLKEYPNDVRLVFRHFPLSFHQNAAKEAEASECVAELGGNAAFWKFHDKIFTETTSNGTGIALTRLGPMASEVGVNQAAFQKCLDSGKYAEKVAKQMQEGSEAGVEGTPATFVNGKVISGAVPFATFKTQIDAELKK